MNIEIVILKDNLVQGISAGGMDSSVEIDMAHCHSFDDVVQQVETKLFERHHLNLKYRKDFNILRPEEVSFNCYADSAMPPGIGVSHLKLKSRT